MPSLQQYVMTQIPIWARPDNPVLRYTLQRFGRRRARRPLLRWLLRSLLVLTLMGVMGISYRAYENGSALLVNRANTSALFAILYSPLLLAQLLMLFWALLLTSSMLPHEQQRGTWEPLKITSHGAEMAMRARWAAVFYQLRWILVALVTVRLLFAGQMLIDLMDYQGRHLDLYMMGITPELPVEAGVILLAAFLTAALLQLLVAVGLNAAIGLLISTVFRSQQMALMVQILALLVQAAIFGVALVVGLSVVDQDPAFGQQMGQPAAERWISVLLMAGVGDHGLRLMDLRTFLETWPGIDYGIFLGAGILIVMALQAVLTNGMLEWAARRAARPSQE